MAWTILSGVIEQFFDQRVLDLGRYEFWSSLGQAPQDYRPLEPQTDACKAAFVAQRHPWRLALLPFGPDEPGSAVIWDDQAWAALGGDPPIATGDPSAPDGGGSHGDMSARALLLPSWLDAVLEGLVSARFEVDTAVLHAAAREGVEAAGCLTSLGTDPNQVEYDTNLQIITSWTSTLNGELGRHDRVSQLIVVA